MAASQRHLALHFSPLGVEGSRMPPGSTAASILSSCLVATFFVCAFVFSRSGSPSSPCAGASTGASTSAGSGRGSGRRSRRRPIDRTISHLEGNNTTKRPSSIVISNLQKTNPGLAIDLPRAGRSGGDGEGDVEVLVDVRRALLDDARVLEQGPHVRLLGDAARAVAPGPGDVGRRLGQGPVGELARCRGVDDGLDGAAAVRGHDVEDACDLRIDLGEGAAAGEFLGRQTSVSCLLNGGFFFLGGGGLCLSVWGRTWACATMSTVFLPLPVVLPRPFVWMSVLPNTVVSTSVWISSRQ